MTGPGAVGTLATMATTRLQTRRWTRFEYERLVELGVFKPGERLELLDGRLVVAEPQGVSHATGIRMAEEALRTAFRSGWDVRVQMPIALDSRSEPEPDVAVVPGSFRDYRHEHPSRPVLVVEVAEGSLDLDRRKARLYARAGVPEFWLVDLVDDFVEVHRVPQGSAYGEVHRLGRGDVVTPLHAPDVSIPVGELLP